MGRSYSLDLRVRVAALLRPAIPAGRRRGISG